MSIEHGQHTIRFKKKEIAQIIQESRTGKLTGILFGFAPDYLELDAFLSPLVVTNQQYNFFKYSNNQVDQLISLSRQMVNEFDRNTVIKKALEILTEDCSISFLGSIDGNYLIKNNIEGFSTNGLGFHALDLSSIYSREKN